jgi:lactoylglutathione lyase
MPKYEAVVMSRQSPKITPTRLLHAMIRVGNLTRSLAFYCDVLGMVELRREDFPEARFTLVFIGYGTEASDTVLELTWNYDEDGYAHGTTFGHIALGVPDIEACCEQLLASGVKITRAPGPMAHNGTENQPDVIAFIEDPDGYQIELIERP